MAPPEERRQTAAAVNLGLRVGMRIGGEGSNLQC